MNTITRSVAMLLCLASGLAAVELPKVPAGTSWLLHADTTTLMQGELGSWINDVCKDPQIEATLKIVEAVSGFDPRRDLRSVTLCGPDRDERKAVALLKGRFDADRLVVLLQTNPSYRKSSYGDFAVHNWIDKKDQKEQWASIAGGDCIVFAQSEAVLKGLLDVYADRAPALDVGASFGTLPMSDQAFFVGVANNIKANLQDLPPEAAILRQLDSLSLSLAEEAGILKVEARSQIPDAESAKHLENMLRGLISLAAINPEVSSKPILKQAIDSCELTYDAGSLQLRCSVPIAQLRLIISQHIKQLQGAN